MSARRILRIKATPFLVTTMLLVGESTPVVMAAPIETVLHAFQVGDSDGIIPAGGVVFDSQGNLYGATSHGGSSGSGCFGGSGCGTVYELTPGQRGQLWTETILYNFTGKAFEDGELPTGGLVLDAAGNLYGVTAYGGTGTCAPIGEGCGIIYEISPPNHPGGGWTETIIYSFQGGADGELPNGNLVFDSVGNLYGTTTYGGGFGSCNAPFYTNCGTIFELSPSQTPGGSWTEQVLYAFKNGADGANPLGGLVFDKHGAMYGATTFGGVVPMYGIRLPCETLANPGCGTIFKLSPPAVQGGTWGETIIHRFLPIGGDGVEPMASLAIDSAGNLYGTTIGGGSDQLGTVFRLTVPRELGQPWTEDIVFNFSGRSGNEPTGPILIGIGERLYGTASLDGPNLAGVLFRLSPPSLKSNSWIYTNVCNFGQDQAAGPEYSLTWGKDGALYGVTEFYDHVNSGAVFKVGN